MKRDPDTPSIHSRGNQLVRSLRLLRRSPDDRRREGAYLAVGVRLVEEALQWQAPVECALCSPRLARHPRGRDLERRLAGKAERMETVTDDLLAWILGTPSHQGVAVRLTRQEASLQDVIDPREDSLLLIAWAVQDPGNLGGLLRVAAAAGAAGMLAVAGCADPYNLKAVRASGGALFHLATVANLEGVSLLKRLGQAGYCRVGAVARGGVALRDADWRSPTAIIVGGEAAGIPAPVSRALERRVTVPMAPGVESLNVLSAATLVLYEAAHQKGLV